MGVAALLMGMQPAHATPGINNEINYQARLLNSAGATVPDGTYNIEFKIYSGGTGRLCRRVAARPVAVPPCGPRTG